MTCPGCLIALSGFGEDAPAAPTDAMVGGGTGYSLPPMALTMPDAAAKSLGSGVLALFIAPTIGSVLAATVGAIAWKEHRVWGGVIGFIAGGTIGAIIGAFIAKKKIEAALPDLQHALEKGGLPDDPFAPPPGGWKTGPLPIPGISVVRPLIPKLKLLTGELPAIAPSEVRSDGKRTINAGSSMNDAIALKSPAPQRVMPIRFAPGTKQVVPNIQAKQCPPGQGMTPSGLCVENLR